MSYQTIWKYTLWIMVVVTERAYSYISHYNVNERQLTVCLKNFLRQKLTDKIKIFSKLMYHLLRIKRESDTLVIEVYKASLTEITGLSTFN